MREWQVGDSIGDGNDTGVPDIPYMGYLKDNDANHIKRTLLMILNVTSTMQETIII